MAQVLVIPLVPSSGRFWFQNIQGNVTPCSILNSINNDHPEKEATGFFFRWDSSDTSFGNFSINHYDNHSFYDFIYLPVKNAKKEMIVGSRQSYSRILIS